jgi:hemolysin III
MTALSSAAVEEKVKPRFRGSLHFIAFFVALAAGAALASLTPLHGGARAGAAIYAIGLALMLGASGFYHRPMWSPAVRRIMKKVDHAAIFFQIAGTYTAFWSLTPDALRSVALLAVMWSSAVVGAVAFAVFTDTHRAVRAGAYVAIGLSTLPLAWVMPQVIGWGASGLVLASSGLYMIGAVVYARRWPNPNPRVFGYHEVFHLLVVLAAAVQFWVIARQHWQGGAVV